jgi:hypothetical protein
VIRRTRPRFPAQQTVVSQIEVPVRTIVRIVLAVAVLRLLARLWTQVLLITSSR